MNRAVSSLIRPFGPPSPARGEGEFVRPSAAGLWKGGRGLGTWRAGRPDTRDLDGGTAGAQDFHEIAVNHQAGAGFGNVLEIFHDQSVQSAGFVGRKIPAELAVQVPQADGAAYQVTAIALGMDIVDLADGLGGKIADDFLEDFVQRYQPLDVAVFIHHEADAALDLSEIQQLRVEGGA